MPRVDLPELVLEEGGGLVASVDGMRSRSAMWTPARPAVLRPRARGDLAQHDQRPGQPKIIVTDTASYSGAVVGLVHLLAWPIVRNLPTCPTGRCGGSADYGPLNTAARRKIDLAKIRPHWADILRSGRRVGGSAGSGSEPPRCSRRSPR